MSFDQSSPDFKLFNEIIDLRREWIGIKEWGHPRYSVYDYPQRLCILSDMNRVYILRELGDIDKYLQIEAEINAMPQKGASPLDTCIFDMTNWLRDSINSIVPIHSEKQCVVLSLLAYGKEYTKKCIDIVFKTLMADGNIPTLCKEKQPLFHIQTSIESRDTFESAPIVEKMKQLGVNFQYAIIPESLMKQIDDASVYWLVGAAATLGIEYARACNAVFHHTYPDIVYSDKYFAELLRLSKTHKAILSPAHRTDQFVVFPRLKPYENDEAISIPSPDLVALSLDAIHMCHWPTIVNNRPAMWCYPVHHYLVWESHEFVHFNCPHLNALWIDPEVIEKFPKRYYISLDSELDFLCEGENYYIPQQDDDLYMIEFSNQGKQRVEDNYTDAVGFAQNFWRLSTNRDNFKFFVRGMKCRINRKVRPVPHNVMQDNGIMNEKVYLINTIQSKDPGVGSGLTRPRTHVGRIYAVTAGG